MHFVPGGKALWLINRNQERSRPQRGRVCFNNPSQFDQLLPDHSQISQKNPVYHCRFHFFSLTYHHQNNRYETYPNAVHPGFGHRLQQ